MNSTYAKIIEDFIAGDNSISSLSKKYSYSKCHIGKILSLYFKPADGEVITLPSKINRINDNLEYQ